MKQSNKIICFTGDGVINVNLFRLFKSMSKYEDSIQVMDWDRSKKHKNSETINQIAYKFIMRGWGYKNNLLLLGNLLWMGKVFYYSLTSKPDLFWASNFQNALPLAISTFFTKIPFVYYIHDNISISYHWPKAFKYLIESLDNWAISRASKVIVPDENRILPHTTKLCHKFEVLPNVPLKNLTLPIDFVTGGDLIIFVLGTLWDTRGIDTLFTAVEGLQKCRILVAGNIPQDHMKAKILSNPKVEYKGNLSQTDTFKLYTLADLVFIYYDPAITINRIASPTKLYEAMMLGRPVIMNNEVMVSKKITEWDIGYTFGYNDSDSLRNLLEKLSIDKSDLEAKGRKAYQLHLSKLNWDYFESKFWNILRESAKG